MHDIDRTLTELEADVDDALYGGDELEFEDEYEYDDDEYEYEYDDDEYEYDDDEYEVLLPEHEELELASDLVNVGDDEELELFFRKLFRRVGRAAKRVGRGVRRAGRKLFKKGVLRRLGRGLKRVVKRATPLAGSAVGGVFGGPAGAMMGGQIGRSVGGVFELELDGLSPEQQELEVARKVVKLAVDATSRAARGSQTSASPERIVKTSLEQAARRHAPGLLRPSGASMARSRGRARPEHRGSGRWVRRGDKIVLYGV